MKDNSLALNIEIEGEKNANVYNVKCVKITILLSIFTLLANEFNIFVVDKNVMRLTFILCNICFFATVIYAKLKGECDKWTKYVILGTYVCAVAIINCLLTYHMILFWGIPFLMASHYRERKISIYVYVCTVIGIIVSVLVGYKYGVTEMNYISLTTGPVTVWNETMEVVMSKLDMDRAIKILTYFALPRIMTVTIYAQMSFAIADSVAEMEKSKRKMQYENIHDVMTGLYNKKYYKNMKKMIYPNKKKLGVIFMDINNLKEINDTLGHDKGDRLIEMTAKSIEYITSDNVKAYRVGGDEFVIVVEEPMSGDVENLIVRWKRALEKINGDSEVKCSVAVGSAEGKGEEIDMLYRIADEDMYVDKTQTKMKMKNNQ